MAKIIMPTSGSVTYEFRAFGPTPTNTPVPTETPTLTPTVTPTLTSTHTPTSTPVPSPSGTYSSKGDARTAWFDYLSRWLAGKKVPSSE